MCLPVYKSRVFSYLRSIISQAKFNNDREPLYFLLLRDESEAMLQHFAISPSNVVPPAMVVIMRKTKIFHNLVSPYLIYGHYKYIPPLLILM